MGRKFYVRENLKDIIDDDLYHAYRKDKSRKPKRYTRKENVFKGVRDIFRMISEMLGECNHGVYLKDFGIFVPKDVEIEVESGLFKTEAKVYNTYRFFFENEYFFDQYKAQIKAPTKHKVRDRIRKPRPYAVILHRKKIRKNKPKDNGEDNS